MSYLMVKSGAGTVRLWVDELPDGADFECERMLEGPRVPAKSSMAVNEILVEMASLSNHWQYALLGGRFKAATDAEFHIEACIGSRGGPPPEWLFAQTSHGFGAVTIGLSEIFAGLAASIPTQFSDGSLPAGVLRICCAAEAYAGTSAISISTATFLILQTLARGTPPEDEDQLRSAASAAWTNARALPREFFRSSLPQKES
jgi:hypothetical protein